MKGYSGIFVCFLGIDGSGKSTIIYHLTSRLRKPFRSIVDVHLMLRSIRNKGSGHPVFDPHGKPQRSKFSSILKLVYYWFEYTLGYWCEVRPALSSSTMFIFDRYYHDLFVDPRRYRYGGPLWAARLFGALIPIPDLFIFLDLPAEVAHARKPEVSLDEAQRLRQSYLALARKLPNAQVVDANQPLEDVVIETEKIILSQLQKRNKAKAPKERVV